MKKILILLLFAVVFGLSTVAVDAQENSYANTIKMFREIPAVAKFFNNSYGYAVFPIIGKAETQYINGMATFVHIKGGFMAEASAGGQKFTFEPYRSSL